MNPTSVERKFTYISEKLGFRVTAHMLRHTSASIAIEQGAPPPCVAERLGHSKIETTINVYTHPSSDCEAKVGAILAGVLDGLETHQEEYER